MATVGVLILVHAMRVLVLTEPQDVEFVLAFGFIPARYGSHVALGGALPGGFAADLWTFFTYAFIHADLTHLGVNLAWLLPFAWPLRGSIGRASPRLPARSPGVSAAGPTFCLC